MSMNHFCKRRHAADGLKVRILMMRKDASFMYIYLFRQTFLPFGSFPFDCTVSSLEWGNNTAP